MNRYLLVWALAVLAAFILRFFGPPFWVSFSVASPKGRIGVDIHFGTVAFWVITFLATGILALKEIGDLIASAKASFESRSF